MFWGTRVRDISGAQIWESLFEVLKRVTAITGFRRPVQVDPILAAAELELSEEDVEELEGG